MNRLLRPGVLVVVSVALAVGAAVVVLWPIWQGSGGSRAVPQPVPEGDQEIVWLNAATNNVGWERFVAAVRRLTEQPELQLQVVADDNAFPSHTTAVPELAVTVGGNKGRLWFRWYKLTGETGTAQWVQALAQRQPPPLAIIGGGSSDRARDLAQALNELRPRLPAPPLFLITTATADQVTLGTGTAGLMEVYPQRSFRFCFTNHQMAEAVTDFIWSRDELRPDAEPVYLAHWEDDPYSEDLFNRFRQVLWGDDGTSGVLGRARQAKMASRAWAWFAGRSVMGGIPPGLDLQGIRCEAVRPPGPFSVPIPYSVGTFGRPNHWEAEAAEKLLDEQGQHPRQQRPLLVLPVTPEPGRRFLRALMRTAPVEAARFVVATGDGIDFNVIYRDRTMTWPIQDLPFSLVLFCHRDPVDPSAFQPDVPGRQAAVPDPGGRTSTGTQDLLLYRDIVATVARAAYTDQGLLGSADALRDRLREATSPDGRRRFNEQGNTPGGGGEYVVWLRPIWAGDRVLPRALLSVWNRAPGADGRSWRRVPVDGLPELIADYTSGIPAELTEGAP